jgi:sugar phosphate isomerase/epimerase
MEWILSAFADEAGGSCAEQIAALQRANLKYIDIRGVEGFNIAALPVSHARQVKTQLDDAGISCHMFGSPIGKIDIADDFNSDLERLRHLAELAPILDCSAVRIFSFYNKETRAQNEFQAESLRRLSTLKAEAEKLGLVLFHENEKDIFGEGLEAVQVLARELRDGKTFKLIFDFDNYNQAGDDVWRNWEALRDATDAFHLKDSTRENQHVPIGQGNGKAREILNDAKNRGWNGMLSVEPHLSHSSAVMATGPSGQQNQEYSAMSLPDSFHAAVSIAQDLISEVGASWK